MSTLGSLRGFNTMEDEQTRVSPKHLTLANCRYHLLRHCCKIPNLHDLLIKISLKLGLIEKSSPSVKSQWGKKRKGALRVRSAISAWPQ